MAGLKDVVKQQLDTGMYLLEQFTKDLSDEEYFHCAAEGTNHVGWILGHLACSEDWAVALITGVGQQLPQSTHELFRGGSVCRPDPTRYPSRKELDDLYGTRHGHMLEALAAFDEGKWDADSPPDAPREFFPTLGSLWGMQSTHLFWHIGQMSTVRSSLKKKPILG